jgi:hypothetical protein
MHIDAGMRQGEMILYSICLQYSNKLFLYARVGGGFIKISYRKALALFMPITVENHVYVKAESDRRRSDTLSKKN